MIAGKVALAPAKRRGGCDCIVLCAAALARRGSNVLIVAKLLSTALAGRFARAERAMMP
jgi:hypothetical protein